MKSMRLTQQMRQNIVNNFLAKRDEKQPKPEGGNSVEQLKAELAEGIWKKVYGGINLSNVPDDMLCTNNSVRIQWPNGSVDWLYYLDDKGSDIRKPSTSKSKVEYIITEDCELYVEYKSNLEEAKAKRKVVEDWKKERESFADQVRQVVDAVNTTKQLLEVWPECESFIPSDIRDPSSITLPSVNLAELSKQV